MEDRFPPKRLDPVVHRIQEDAAGWNRPDEFALYVEIDVIESFTAVPKEQWERFVPGVDLARFPFSGSPPPRLGGEFQAATRLLNLCPLI
jgi:hypothetical protein